MGDRTDGRSDRKIVNIAKIVATCRSMMMAGSFRPTMIGVATEAGLSIRTAFAHYRGVSDLYREALKESAVGDAMLARILGPELQAISPLARGRIIEAIGWGSVEPLPVVDQPASTEQQQAA